MVYLSIIKLFILYEFLINTIYGLIDHSTPLNALYFFKYSAHIYYSIAIHTPFSTIINSILTNEYRKITGQVYMSEENLNVDPIV
jgi:hypothetical protein